MSVLHYTLVMHSGGQGRVTTLCPAAVSVKDDPIGLNVLLHETKRLALHYIW